MNDSRSTKKFDLKNIYNKALVYLPPALSMLIAMLHENQKLN